MASHRVAPSETLRDIAQLYYSNGDAVSALARANGLRMESALAAGAVIKLPARLMGYGGISERAEMSTVVDMVLYERRSDLIFVEVLENVYPGSAHDFTAIDGKWLYVVSDGAVVVRVEACGAADWDADNQHFGGRRTIVDATLPLLAGHSYSFFLAPHQLSLGAERYLLEHVSECLTVSHLEAGNRDTKVLVRDVYQWALDLHHKLYLPKLRKWQTWLEDKDRSSRLFIASTLKCLIEQKDPGWLWDGTDPLGIRDQLQEGQPERYIEQVHLAQEREQRIEAERAAALVAELIDSYDFRTMEKAALDEAGSSLEVAVLAWACVLPGIIQTQPGRELAARVVADESRIPAALIFTKAPSVNTPQFPQVRYLTNAALAIVKDLAPSWVALHRARNDIDPLQYLQAFLERLSNEKLELRGTQRQMHSNLKAGRPLTHKVKNAQRVRMKLIAKSGLAAALVSAAPPATLIRSQLLSQAYQRNFATAQVGIRAVLEVVNLANALGELQAEASARKIMSAVGAVADGGSLLAEVLAEALETVLRESSRAALKNGAMGLGFISGVCDCLEFGIVASEKAAKHDYNAAVGNTIAATGAGAIMISAAVGLSSALGAPMGATAAALAPPLGILGAALVGVGSLIGQLCLDNSYEEFAKLCFLGKACVGEPAEWPWTSQKLPDANVAFQKEALMQLLATFRVALRDDAGATIYPGYYEDGDVFEVYVQHPDENRARFAYLEVCPRSGDIRQLQGEPLAPLSYVTFDEAGRAQKIWLCETLADLGREGVRVTRSRLLQVRLRRGNQSGVPAKRPSEAEAKCVEVMARYGVLGPNRRAASSSQDDYRASPKYSVSSSSSYEQKGLVQ